MRSVLGLICSLVLILLTLDNAFAAVSIDPEHLEHRPKASQRHSFALRSTSKTDSLVLATVADSTLQILVENVPILGRQRADIEAVLGDSAQAMDGSEIFRLVRADADATRTAPFFLKVWYVYGRVYACELLGDPNANPIPGSFIPNQDDERSAWLEEFDKRVRMDWCKTGDYTNESAVVEALLGADGTVYDAKILVPSMNRQFDIDCLQAVYSPSRFRTISSDLPLGLQSKTWQFFATSEAPALHHHEASLFSIPIDVLTRYPGIFKEQELKSTSNLMPFAFPEKSGNNYVSADDGLLVNQHFRKWNAFFAAHPTATRDELYEESKSSK